MMMLREFLGQQLRAERVTQRRTLRDVASASNVALGYLSEIERGHKEASSELLSSVCAALGVSLSTIMLRVSQSALTYENSVQVLHSLPQRATEDSRAA